MKQYSPDAVHMNIGSDAQKAHLLFAPCDRVKASAVRGPDGKLHKPVQTDLTGPKVVLGTPDTFAADATQWPEFREFQVCMCVCVFECTTVCGRLWFTM